MKDHYVGETSDVSDSDQSNGSQPSSDEPTGNLAFSSDNFTFDKLGQYEVIATINVASSGSVTIDNGDILALNTESNPTANLTATVTVPTVYDNADAGVTWTSSDPEIATVDSDGVVTALASGVVQITASSNYQVTTTTVQSIMGRTITSTDLLIASETDKTFAAIEGMSSKGMRNFSENGCFMILDGEPVLYFGQVNAFTGWIKGSADYLAQYEGKTVEQIKALVCEPPKDITDHNDAGTITGDIDAIAGATASSNVIAMAVKNAIDKLG